MRGNKLFGFRGVWRAIQEARGNRVSSVEGMSSLKEIEVKRAWNAFTLEGKTFELGVSYWQKSGEGIQYMMSVTSLTKYAYHHGNPFYEASV